jgi:hypothetical protein
MRRHDQKWHRAAHRVPSAFSLLDNIPMFERDVSSAAAFQPE